jgi:hypothetical protein
MRTTVGRWRCFHCHSERPPGRITVHTSPTNRNLMVGVVALSLLTCCLGAPIFLVLYFLVAQRTSVCRDCGMRLESH